jgi:prepilin-type N-terminal cleavage/methylation domain-containing protein
VRRGFTLIEMSAVLLLMALLSAAVAVNLTGSKHRADLTDAADQINAADAAVRAIAGSTEGPVRLTISPSTRKLRRDTPGRPAVTIAELPADVTVESIRLAGSAVSYNDAAIAFTAGRSPTYAVRLSAPGGQHEWIVIAGLTGKSSVETDEAVDAIFAAVTPRADAD